MYHYVVEGTSMKDGSKVPPEVRPLLVLRLLFIVLMINQVDSLLLKFSLSTTRLLEKVSRLQICM